MAEGPHGNQRFGANAPNPRARSNAPAAAVSELLCADPYRSILPSATTHSIARNLLRTGMEMRGFYFLDCDAGFERIFIVRDFGGLTGSTSHRQLLLRQRGGSVLLTGGTGGLPPEF